MTAEPAAATRHTTTYPGRADQLHHVRSAVASHLAGCAAADDAVLIASELAANAILHSRSRGTHFTICTELHPDHVRIEAEDSGGPWRRRQPDGRPHGLEHGRSPHRPGRLGHRDHHWRRPDRLGAPRPGHDGRMSQHVRHCPACDGRGIRDVSDVSRRQTASVNVPARLTSVGFMQSTAAWAEGLARTLLADTLPRRWAHVQGVAAQARTLKSSLGADANLVEAAAWLHDIGYLPELAATGLHGLDGAR